MFTGILACHSGLLMVESSQLKLTLCSVVSLASPLDGPSSHRMTAINYFGERKRKFNYGQNNGHHIYSGKGTTLKREKEGTVVFPGPISKRHCQLLVALP